MGTFEHAVDPKPFAGLNIKTIQAAVLWKRLASVVNAGQSWSQTILGIREVTALVAYRGLVNDGPLVVNICGPPGVGKSTLTNKVAEQLRIRGHTVAILHEEDGAIDRSLRLARSLSGIHPASFEIDRLLSYFTSLRNGIPVDVNIYDHSAGTRLGAYRHEASSSYILLDGSIWALHPLAAKIAAHRTILLLPKSLRLWREVMVSRDTLLRGYTLQEAQRNFKNYVRDVSRVLSIIQKGFDATYVLGEVEGTEYRYWDATAQLKIGFLARTAEAKKTGSASHG